MSDLPNNVLLPNNMLPANQSEFFHLKNLLVEYEKNILQQFLKSAVTTEDKKSVAKKLGIGLSTLYKKMELYNIE